jgi:hypothetical protein
MAKEPPLPATKIAPPFSTCSCNLVIKSTISFGARVSSVLDNLFAYTTNLRNTKSVSITEEFLSSRVKQYYFMCCYVSILNNITQDIEALIKATHD